jgi:DHA1 family bicyclomycin/chloramphenicol resistance-like MFS transporter
MMKLFYLKDEKSMIKNIGKKPFIHISSPRVYECIYTTLLVLMFVAICAEADLYVPAFPEMVRHFGVPENAIQMVLGINFAGICLAGIISGPLSDAFGRRPLLNYGLIIFSLASFGCLYAHTFYQMLAWRFVQGIGASVPMIVMAASAFDRYPEDKAASILGFVNSLITTALALAPLVGAYLTQHFGWRSNFVVIFCLTCICMFGILLFLTETLNADKRNPMNLKQLARDYKTLFSSIPFLSYSFIVMFPLAVLIVYIANLSVIFVTHLGLDLTTYSVYQATTPGTFVIFSSLTGKAIKRFGLDRTALIGLICLAVGSGALLYTGLIYPAIPEYICVCMALVAAGGALMLGPFSVKVMGVFPDIKGTALAASTVIRQLLSVGCVALSQYFFNGTIVPVVVIIFAGTVIIWCLFLNVLRKQDIIEEIAKL